MRIDIVNSNPEGPRSTERSKMENEECPDSEGESSNRFLISFPILNYL